MMGAPCRRACRLRQRLASGFIVAFCAGSRGARLAQLDGAARSSPPTAHTAAAVGETIHTTANHPWLTTDRGWVQEGGLRIGEHVVELAGRTATVTALAVRPRDAYYYNLTVSQLHTFAVGSGQFVVHNTKCPSGFDYDAASQSGKRADKGGLTRAGREYQKHMGRGELPRVRGSNLDSAGQNLLDDILTDPNADYQPVTGGGFAGAIDHWEQRCQ